MSEKTRCRWIAGKSVLYTAYHDNEWGRPVHDDGKLYEMFLLECFQAGLSWITILNKRENFRKAFDQFDYRKIGAYSEEKIEQLMQDAGIIRNRRKIEAAVKNTQIFMEIQKEFGTFDAYLWGFTDGKVIMNEDDVFRDRTALSDKVSKDLQKRKMTFVGSVTIYSYLQAVGIVNDHDKACFCRLHQDE